MTPILEGLNAHVFDLRANRSSSRGFTLIELMIVVAIVAILAAIAYPSYAEYVRKSRRAQAKADLMEYGQLAERWHTVQNTYVGYTLPGGATVAFSPREGGTSAYRIDLSQVTQGAFMLTATALNAQAADKCGNLTLDQANRKGNSRGTKSDCW